MRLISAVIAPIGISLCMSVAASAGVANASANVDVLVAPPASLELGQLQSDTLVRLVIEQSITLGVGLNVDITTSGLFDDAADLTPGVLAAGTAVQSHLLHTDPSSNSATYRGFVTFDADVIGIIVGRSLLLTSDLIVGLPGVVYSTNQARGIEFNTDALRLTVNSRTVEFDWRTTGAIDEIRVLTIPGPAAASVLGLGTLALRRRR